MTNLAEFMIIAGADNRPPMLEKSLHVSWKSRMEHYMKNRENGRMILNSVQNGPLIWLTITEADGTTLKKKYEELSTTKKIQAGCDCILPIHSSKFDSLLCEGGNTVSVLLGFAQLINNRMLSIWQMRSSSVNTKFLNSLPPE
ncbi:hypothetical protein Tco_1212493 [Tanacetum coccineum]